MTRLNTNTPDNVVDLYLTAFNENKANQPSVWARENGFSYPALKWRATKLNIQLPSRSVCNLDSIINWDEQIDLIDGHMLGDGCLVNPKKRKTSVIQNSCAKKDYLDWCVQNTPFWDNCNVWEVISFDKRTYTDYVRYWIKSSASHFLEVQRQRWYPNGKKRLPIDVQITARGLLRFFIEDGGNCPHGGVIFSVHEFTPDEITIIKDKIEILVNHECTIWTEHNKPVKIYLPKPGLNSFYSIIGECPVESFKYKWGQAA